MPSYAAPDCNNRSERDKERGVSFHNVPVKQESLAKKWLDQLCRDKRFGLPKKLTNVYVCSEHFTELTVLNSYKFELIGGTSRKRSLKKEKWKSSVAVLNTVRS